MWRLLQVEEEGVTFRSPTDGSMMLLTPERRQVQQQPLVLFDSLLDAAHACEQHPNAERDWCGRDYGA